MWAFLFGRAGAYTVVTLIVLLTTGAVIWHVHAQTQAILSLNGKLAVLEQQAQSLKAANDALRTDIDAVQRAQTQADRSLADVRREAAAATARVRHRTFTAGNSGTIEQQVNKEMSDTFHRLEAVSRAP